MTRQQQLDTINMKIARTSQSDEWTGYFLPVTFKNVLEFFPENEDEISLEWWDFWDPLDKQSDDCISYIYSLIK